MAALVIAILDSGRKNLKVAMINAQVGLEVPVFQPNFGLTRLSDVIA